ncbi:hypothetical protein C8R47DRAFT_1068782 [Mycena vitilis]|nr:hypothetical protein C8R47DRAFT_1068782 [Mycena vitilis]
MAQSARTVTSVTFRRDIDTRPARICPRCNRIAKARVGSVSTAKAQKRFISFIPVKSWMVWRCRKCGWNAPISADWEPAVSNALSGGRPSTAQEVNPMFRMAEGWYRPPSNLFAEYPSD